MMLKKYKAIPNLDGHYPLDWLNGHRKVVGFMEAPIDGKFMAHSKIFYEPFQENILSLIEEYHQFAPYYAVLANVMMEDETKTTCLILRYGAL